MISFKAASVVVFFRTYERRSNFNSKRHPWIFLKIVYNRCLLFKATCIEFRYMSVRDRQANTPCLRCLQGAWRHPSGPLSFWPGSGTPQRLRPTPQPTLHLLFIELCVFPPSPIHFVMVAQCGDPHSLQFKPQIRSSWSLHVLFHQHRRGVAHLYLRTGGHGLVIRRNDTDVENSWEDEDEAGC